MTSLYDIQLIENYQNYHNECYYLELYDRYKYFLKKHSYRIFLKFRSFNNGYCLEDIDEEMKIALLNAVYEIDRKKIRNENRFCFAHWILFYIKRFENNNMQISQCEIDTESSQFSDNNTNDLYEMKNILKTFEEYLNKQEKEFFKLRLEGKKIGEICNIMKLSRQRLSRVHSQIKRKYRDYILN